MTNSVTAQHRSAVVALYGGGKYLQVSHEFFLNGHTDNPYCEGVEGILSAYKHSLNTVQLYGPTNFAPIINHVARLVLEKGGGGWTSRTKVFSSTVC